MILTPNIHIKLLAVHSVGNKSKEESLFLSQKLSDDFVDNRELESAILSYFFNGFKSDEFFNLHHDVDLMCNEVYNYVSNIFDNSDCFLEYSGYIAKHLYDKCLHPNIKSGELYVAYLTNCQVKDEMVDAIGIFKSENKNTFLDVYANGNQIKIKALTGIDINKLDKGCIILNTKRADGYIIRVVDNTNKGIEARFWIDDFLQIRQNKDEYFNTNQIMSMCKTYVTKRLPTEFNITKVEQVDILNSTMSYFKEKDTFSMDEFSKEVIGDERLTESFQQFKSDYEQENDITIEDGFEISDAAVKKQNRSYKSVIKLDKNFHIYVHGNNQYIKKGYDESTGMYYYQLFFKEEL